MIADTPRDAISAARPPVNKKAELLFWLRAAGWTTLAACGLALIWDSPITALVNVTMALACCFLIFKIKSKMPLGV